MSINPLEFAAVMQTERNPKHTSDKYKFISTGRVLEQLQDNGWQVIGGNQAKVKDPTKDGYQKHALKLENPNLNRILPSIGKPQLLLRNSHEGSSSLQLLAAFHVFVCSNGAVSHSGDIGDIRILHRSFTEDALQAAITEFTHRVPKMVQQVEEWNTIQLTEPEQLVLARQAIELRFDPIKDSYGVATPNYPVTSSQVLRSRRYGEKPTTLWTAFNTLQENLIEKGGLTGARNANGRRIPIKAVKSVDTNIKLNKAFWAISQHMADIKLGRTQLELNFN